MIIEIKVPSPGESISEVQLANWLVKDGDFVEKDQEIAEIDSDKATLTISTEQSGIIKILVEKGANAEVGAVIARIETDGKTQTGKKNTKTSVENTVIQPKAEPEKKTSAKPESEPVTTQTSPKRTVKPHLSPLARKLMETSGANEGELMDFLSTYRFSKADIQFFLDERQKIKEMPKQALSSSWGGTRETEIEKMSTLRLKLAHRLVSVKNETAMLTTFNEVNMSPVIKIRQQYKDLFKEKFAISLGFMSFFTKAVTEALQLFPRINARIDGEEIVYHHYADIGIAVSTPKGLMVPVIRNAEQMSLAEIEINIKELATKARDNKITLDEMKGGTFTITNGGVFGSMLSTPIINPPQSAILGMHNIVERPIAVNGAVEIHPVMYVALSYDHRVIDGSESVSFLVKVKEMLENPVRMMFGGNDPLVALLGLKEE